MKIQFFSIDCFIFNQVIDAPPVKGTGTPNNSMYLISFFQQELGKIGTILPGYARN
jgi:hypothetical protein